MNRLVNRGMDQWLEGLVFEFFLSAILNSIWMIRLYYVSCPRPRLDEVRGNKLGLPAAFRGRFIILAGNYINTSDVVLAVLSTKLNQWRSEPDIRSCKCRFFSVYRPYKESICKEMNNNDLNLHNMTE